MVRSNDKWHANRFRWIAASILVTSLIIAACYKPPTRGGMRFTAGPKGQFGVSSESRDYVRDLDFSLAGFSDNVLVDKYACTGCPAEGVRLMFIPEANAEKANWQKAMASNGAGYVVAAVVNVDGREFTDLKLQPGDIAYAWVGQVGSASTQRGFAVYKINSQGIAEATWSLTYDIYFCDDGQKPKPAIKSGHPGQDPCDPIRSAQTSFGAAVAYAAPAPAISALVGVGKLWITCDQGCCEVKTT